MHLTTQSLTKSSHHILLIMNKVLKYRKIYTFSHQRTFLYRIAWRTSLSHCNLYPWSIGNPTKIFGPLIRMPFLESTETRPASWFIAMNVRSVQSQPGRKPDSYLSTYGNSLNRRSVLATVPFHHLRASS